MHLNRARIRCGSRYSSRFHALESLKTLIFCLAQGLLLLLDEPVAGMTDQETERTAELFLSLKGKHSLMVVEHDMAFIRQIADVVTVLCDGSVLAQGSFDDVQDDERVIEVYLGR